MIFLNIVAVIFALFGTLLIMFDAMSITFFPAVYYSLHHMCNDVDLIKITDIEKLDDFECNINVKGKHLNTIIYQVPCAIYDKIYDKQYNNTLVKFNHYDPNACFDIVTSKEEFPKNIYADNIKFINFNDRLKEDQRTISIYTNQGTIITITEDGISNASVNLNNCKSIELEGSIPISDKDIKMFTDRMEALGFTSHETLKENKVIRVISSKPSDGGAKKKGIVYNKVSDRKYTDKDGVKRTLYEKKGVYYVKRKNVHGKMTYKKVTIK
jgi:hypothetical protein